jgi:hypothetical protein
MQTEHRQSNGSVSAFGLPFPTKTEPSVLGEAQRGLLMALRSPHYSRLRVSGLSFKTVAFEAPM